MADKYRVELLAPDGTKVVSSSPADTVDLVYGRGYKVVEDEEQDENQTEEQDEEQDEEGVSALTEADVDKRQ